MWKNWALKNKQLWCFIFLWKTNFFSCPWLMESSKESTCLKYFVTLIKLYVLNLTYPTLWVVMNHNFHKIFRSKNIFMSIFMHIKCVHLSYTQRGIGLIDYWLVCMNYSWSTSSGSSAMVWMPNRACAISLTATSAVCRATSSAIRAIARRSFINLHQSTAPQIRLVFNS